MKHNLKIALRILRKNSLKNFFSILFISIGLFVFSFSFYFIRQINNQYLAWSNYENMASVYLMDKTKYTEKLIGVEQVKVFVDNLYSGIEKVALFSNRKIRNATFVKKEGEVSFECMSVDINAEFLSVYLGNRIREIKENDVVITRSCARKIFENENPIGNVLYLSNPQNQILYYKIVAIIEDFPNSTKEKGELYFLKTNFPVDEKINITVGIVDDQNVKLMNEHFEKIAVENEGKEMHFCLTTFKDQFYSVDNFMTIIVAFVIFGLILISSVVVFLKFRIESFIQRKREMGLRRVLGANKRNLYFLLLAEIFILLLFALFFTFCLTEMMIPFLDYYLPYEIKKIELIDIDKLSLFRQEGEYALVLFFVCMLSIYIIVFRYSSKNILSSISESAVANRFKINILLSLQMVISFLFIALSINAYITYLQLESVRNITLEKSDRESVWWVPLTYSQLKNSENTIVSEIEKYAGVNAVTVFDEFVSVSYTNKDSKEWIGSGVIADSRYVEFMKLSIDGTPPRSPDEIVVSTNFLSQIKEDGLDEIVVLNKKEYHIVGSIDMLPFEVKSQHLRHNDNFNVLFYNAHPSGCLLVKCDENSKLLVKEKITSVIAKFLPITIYSPLYTLDQIYELRYYGLRNIMGLVFRVICFICILMMCLTLYSSIVTDIQRKEKEIAIRKVNGASVFDINRLLVLPYLKIFMCSMLISFPIIYLFLRVSGNNYDFNFRIENSIFFWLSLFFSMIFIVFISIAKKTWQVSRMIPFAMLKK